MSCRRLGLLLLGGLLHLLAFRTNGKTGFLLAVFVYCVCSLLGYVGVGLAVYLALLLPRCAWATAPRARLGGAGWWWCFMSGLPRCVGFVIGMLCVCVKPNAVMLSHGLHSVRYLALLISRLCLRLAPVRHLF